MTTDAAEPTGAADPVAVWGEVLDGYRASLGAHRELLERVHGDADLAGFEHDLGFAPPADLPPLPSSMVEEARVLDAQTAELLAAARALLAQLKPPSSAPVHRSILAPPSPSQMDTRL